MKIGIKILAVCLFATLCSCEEWLNVQPKTSIKSEYLFENRDGFEQALIGVYLDLASSKMYGKNGTVLYMDVLSGVYSSEATDETESPYYTVLKRDYLNDKSRRYSDDLFSSIYTSIANINNLLENLEGQSVMSDDIAAVIKGEALGLRAYLHFDLLRMFGPGNLAANSANMSVDVVPYIVTYDKYLEEANNSREILDFIKTDLDESRALLDEFGPFGTNKATNWELNDPNGFFAYKAYTGSNAAGNANPRGFRFNYWAAVMTQARAYMWEGKYEEALALSEEFITKSEIDWVNVNDDLAKDKDFYGVDGTMSREYIFGLEVDAMYSTAGISSVFRFDEEDDADNTGVLYFESAAFVELFDLEGNGGADARAQYCYKETGDRYLNAKFDSQNGDFIDRVSLMKKSEAYYIAAECLVRLGIRQTEAIEYINTVMTARSIPELLELNLTPDELMVEIERERIKDMIGEGQLFYFFKRLNYSSVPFFGTTLSDGDFILPIPEKELNYGTDL